MLSDEQLGRHAIVKCHRRLPAAKSGEPGAAPAPQRAFFGYFIKKKYHATPIAASRKATE
jgi:hypothetical protein